MNRIELLFKQLQHDNKKALATFVTAGDPNIAATRKLVTKMVVAGAAYFLMTDPQFAETERKADTEAPAECRCRF